MRVDVVTIFPGLIGPALGRGMLRIARRCGRLDVRVWDLREFSEDPRHRKVDDRPYGGGPGMVMRPGPIVRAVERIRSEGESPGRTVLLTPQGRRLDQAGVEELAVEDRMILVCGRYEGIDERVVEVLEPDELSIGDYVLSGGELPALVVIEAVARLIPGVVGDPGSVREDSFSRGGLKHPQYTRPAEFRGLEVPPVLRSGDHEAIRAWRADRARARTEERRADLLADEEDRTARPDETPEDEGEGSPA